MGRAKKRAKGPHPYRVTVTRYFDRDGRQCRKGAPGAVPKKTRTETYYADFWEGSTRHRVPLGTNSLPIAWAKINEELKRRHDAALGIRDRFTEAAEKTMEEHLIAWQAIVEANGTTAKQAAAVRHGVEVLATCAGWKRITDIDQDSALLALARCQQPCPEKPKGRSAQTRNHFRSHLRQFVAWAVASGRLRSDPLGRLDRVDVSTDRRHDRRTPTDEEVAQLFEALEKPGTVALRGMTGYQRALGYRVAMATGLRASELRSLTWGSFSLDGRTVTLAASYSKRRREDTILLPPWLASMLKAWQASGGELWAGFPEIHPGQVLKSDLALAGIPYSVRSPGGVEQYFDFHSLRHYFCTEVAHIASISPRTLLALTRHSSVELAMGVYGVTQQGDVRHAVDGMTEPGKKKEKEEEREKKKEEREEEKE